MEKFPIPLRESFANEFESKLKQKLNYIKEDTLNCTSFFEISMCSLIIYAKSDEERYQIFAKGKINHNEALIICRVKKKPKSNRDLPGFIRKFIQIK